MADYCRQCSHDHLGMPRDCKGDFHGITKPEDWAQGLSVPVICEGCGFIQVDPEGFCIGGCYENHPLRYPEGYEAR